MSMKTTGLRPFALLMCLCAGLPAQAIIPEYQYNKRVESSQSITALSDQLMGDSVSLYNGATEFAVTDIDLPGNNALPVRLVRRFPVTLKPSGLNNAIDYELGGARR